MITYQSQRNERGRWHDYEARTDLDEIIAYCDDMCRRYGWHMRVRSWRLGPNGTGSYYTDYETGDARGRVEIALFALKDEITYGFGETPDLVTWADQIVRLVLGEDNVQDQ